MSNEAAMKAMVELGEWCGERLANDSKRHRQAQQEFLQRRLTLIEAALNPPQADPEPAPAPAPQPPTTAASKPSRPRR